MNNELLTNAQITISISTSQYGTSQPEIRVHFPLHTGWRRSSALLHQIAAEVELATSSLEGWIVNLEAKSDEHGRIYLELFKGDDTEARRGLALLRKVMQDSKRHPEPRTVKSLGLTKDGSPQFLLERTDGKQVVVVVPKDDEDNTQIACSDQRRS